LQLTGAAALLPLFRRRERAGFDGMRPQLKRFSIGRSSGPRRIELPEMRQLPARPKCTYRGSTSVRAPPPWSV
jgi:hypothetical protein